MSSDRETVLCSPTKEVVIGPDRPFVIIGEKINPTGRPKLAEQMMAGDFSTVERDALAQVEAGAHVLDVNAGLPLGDEAKTLHDVVKFVQSIVDAPLSIDSSGDKEVTSGMEAYQGRAILNSVTGEDERLETLLPLVKKFDCAVIGMAHDQEGLSPDPDVRIAAAKKIIARAADHGIKKKDVLIDPLVFPVGAVPDSAKITLEVIRRCNEELQVNTSVGASNVSFGLPGRAGLNATYMGMMIAAGLTAAITNPCHTPILEAIMASDVMMARDEQCMRWMKRERAKRKAAQQATAAKAQA